MYVNVSGGKSMSVVCPAPAREVGNTAVAGICAACYLRRDTLHAVDVTHSAVAPLSREVFNALQIESNYPNEY